MSIILEVDSGILLECHVIIGNRTISLDFQTHWIKYYFRFNFSKLSKRDSRRRNSVNLRIFEWWN